MILIPESQRKTIANSVLDSCEFVTNGSFVSIPYQSSHSQSCGDMSLEMNNGCIVSPKKTCQQFHHLKKSHCRHSFLVLENDQIYLFQLGDQAIKQMGTTDSLGKPTSCYSCKPELYDIVFKFNINTIREIVLPYKTASTNSGSTGSSFAARTSELIIHTHDSDHFMDLRFETNLCRGNFLEVLVQNYRKFTGKELEYEHLEMNEYIDNISLENMNLETPTQVLRTNSSNKLTIFQKGEHFMKKTKSLKFKTNILKEGENADNIKKNGIRSVIYNQAKHAVHILRESKNKNRANADGLLDDAEYLSDLSRELDLKAWIITTRGCIEYSLHNCTTAMHHFQRSIRICQEIAFPMLEYINLRYLANVYLTLSDTEASMYAIDAADEILPNNAMSQLNKSWLQLKFSRDSYNYLQLSLISPNITVNQNMYFKLPAIDTVLVLVHSKKIRVAYGKECTVGWLLSEVIRRYSLYSLAEAQQIVGVYLIKSSGENQELDFSLDLIDCLKTGDQLGATLYSNKSDSDVSSIKNKQEECNVKSGLLVPCSICGKSIPLEDVEEHSEDCFR